MAYTILSNKKNTSAVIHINSNSSIIVAGNNSVSNVATSDETITSASIAQAVWGCDGIGHIQVKRAGAIVAVYDSTGQHDYAGCGMPITAGAVSNLDITFVGSANCFLTIEIQKAGTFNNSPYITT